MSVTVYVCMLAYSTELQKLLSYRELKRFLYFQWRVLSTACLLQFTVVDLEGTGTVRATSHPAHVTLGRMLLARTSAAGQAEHIHLVAGLESSVTRVKRRNGGQFDPNR